VSAKKNDFRFKKFSAKKFLCVLTDAADVEITCTEKTRPHSTECNKYFKCIKLPNNTLKWITLTCQEGLIYDNNLRSCAIPDENWDCALNSEEEQESDDYGKDENNIYGIENLRVLEKQEVSMENDDDFLEVIDGDEILSSSGESRSENDEHVYDESSNYSGDGNVVELVTQSTPTVQMITTQVQRLTQLMKNQPKNSADDLTPDDLNSYLDVHKIQTKSPDYENNKFDSSDKTPIPQNGKIHPAIMSEILSRQTQLNTVRLRETTLAMDDEVTPKPVFYVNKEPITEIQLKGGQGIDGMGAHQIVVNRPEGAVLFNVPPSEKSSVKEYTPYLSEDILKTILEISKQMVTQSNNNQKNSDQEHSSRPVYYAIPFPMYSPPSPNNIHGYYNQFMNNSMRPAVEATTTTTTIMPPVEKIRRKPSKKKGGSKMKSKIDFMSQNLNTPQGSYNQIQQQQQQQPFDYNSYYNNYQQNYPSYNTPLNYYQQHPGNDRYTNPNQNMQYNNRYGNLYGNFYENRPLVSDSSAPAAASHVDQIYSTPYRKESHSGVGSDDDEYDDALREESDESENENGTGLNGSFNDQFYDDDSSPPKDSTDGLICSYGVTRQANKTDCMKYYVCNSKTKEVLSYSCPASTAFNDQTKFCDSKTHETCKKMKDREQGKMNNKKYYQEAHKALQQAKLESQKVERLANMVRKESQKILKNKAALVPSMSYDAYEEEEQQQQQQQLPQPVRQRPVQILSRPSKRPVITRKVTVTKNSSVSKPSAKRRKNKKKVKCKTIGNMEDPEDPTFTHYWHCFKSSDNRMKRIHKQCSPNLVFCPDTNFCSPTCR
jgi:hypothetical protein